MSAPSLASGISRKEAFSVATSNDEAIPAATPREGCFANFTKQNLLEQVITIARLAVQLFGCIATLYSSFCFPTLSGVSFLVGVALSKNVLEYATDITEIWDYCPLIMWPATIAAGIYTPPTNSLLVWSVLSYSCLGALAKEYKDKIKKLALALAPMSST